MSPAKLQPALLGGVAIGVLSALPVVNIGNLCCCAWVVFGGALAAYLMQQNFPAPVGAGDGALVGLMAGAIGAVVGSILAIPISMAMGPFQLQILDRIMEGSRDMPPEVREIFEQMRGGMAGGAMLGVAFIFSLMFTLFFYSRLRPARRLVRGRDVPKGRAPAGTSDDWWIHAADVYAALEFPAATTAAAPAAGGAVGAGFLRSSVQLCAEPPC